IYLREFLDEHYPDWHRYTGIADKKPQWLPPLVDKLAIELATRINSAAALNPINMLAIVLLATERHAMDANMLSKVLNCFNGLQHAYPYSTYMSFAEGTGEDWINYGLSINLIQRQSQTLGDIISLTPRNAVALTYNRNNIIHLFAVPSLIASLLQNCGTLEKQKLHDLFRSIYPYIRSELFLRWESDEVDEAFEKWLHVLQQHDLIEIKGNN
ncbi:MAG: glycerol-3-phosphate 1-O-acyltransferase, partial [Phototrophicales bacterium]